jgi:hypothetical protein
VRSTEGASRILIALFGGLGTCRRAWHSCDEALPNTLLEFAIHECAQLILNSSFGWAVNALC